ISGDAIQADDDELPGSAFAYRGVGLPFGADGRLEAPPSVYAARDDSAQAYQYDRAVGELHAPAERLVGTAGRLGPRAPLVGGVQRVAAHPEHDCAAVARWKAPPQRTVVRQSQRCPSPAAVYRAEQRAGLCRD